MLPQYAASRIGYVVAQLRYTTTNLRREDETLHPVDLESEQTVIQRSKKALKQEIVASAEQPQHRLYNSPEWYTVQ